MGNIVPIHPAISSLDAEEVSQLADLVRRIDPESGEFDDNTDAALASTVLRLEEAGLIQLNMDKETGILEVVVKKPKKSGPRQMFEPGNRKTRRARKRRG